jgi:hypothetical protein
VHDKGASVLRDVSLRFRALTFSGPFTQRMVCCGTFAAILAIAAMRAVADDDIERMLLGPLGLCARMRRWSGR